jgi:hypothetical protein
MTADELIERVRELVGFSGSIPSFTIVEKIEEALNEYDYNKEQTHNEREEMDLSGF